MIYLKVKGCTSRSPLRNPALKKGFYNCHSQTSLLIETLLPNPVSVLPKFSFHFRKIQHLMKLWVMVTLVSCTNCGQTKLRGFGLISPTGLIHGILQKTFRHHSVIFLSKMNESGTKKKKPRQSCCLCFGWACLPVNICNHTPDCEIRGEIRVGKETLSPSSQNLHSTVTLQVFFSFSYKCT